MTRRPEPTAEQLQAALDRLAAAAPGIWPKTLPELGRNAARLVRARALQAMGETDLRSRGQLAVLCTLPSGQRFVRWVYAPPTPQLALSEEFK